MGSKEADGSHILWVQAEGLLLGKVEDGTVIPMASDPQGHLVLADDDLLGRHGAWGDALSLPSSTVAPRVYAGMEHLPELGGYELAGARLYHPETGRCLGVGTCTLTVYRLLLTASRHAQGLDVPSLWRGRAAVSVSGSAGGQARRKAGVLLLRCSAGGAPLPVLRRDPAPRPWALLLRPWATARPAHQRRHHLVASLS